jgi:ubiquinone/menaquinone biosynthesis C-methylase UbiE
VTGLRIDGFSLKDVIFHKLCHIVLGDDGRYLNERKVMSSDSHSQLIIEQFTKQSVPFSKVAGHLGSIDHLIQLSGVNPQSEVIDVACGPGLVACAFAKVAKTVVGLDMTPKMIETAQLQQQKMNLNNMQWIVGDAFGIPFLDNHFDLVFARYSFHHLMDTSMALAEMIRVCKPGGVVLVADVAMPDEKSENYDRLELIRDPSHTHALTEHEFEELFQTSSLKDSRFEAYKIEIELEAQLNASFPSEGGKEMIRQMLKADIGFNQYGIEVKEVDGRVWYSVPIRAYRGVK